MQTQSFFRVRGKLWRFCPLAGMVRGRMTRFQRASHTLFWCLGCAVGGSSILGSGCASDPASTADSGTTTGTLGATTQQASVSSTDSGTTVGAGQFSATTATGSTTSGSASSSGGGSGGATGVSSTTSAGSENATTNDSNGGATGSTITSMTGTGGVTASGAGGGGALLPIKVWIAGDSTVANGNTPCPTGWGKHLAQYLSDLVSIDNSAVGGRSVRTWLYNVSTEMDVDTGECVLERDVNGEPTLQARWQGMLDNMSTGDALLIQFGINDGSATCDRHVGLAAFKESYGMMAAAAKDRGADPVFITPVSAIACSGTTPQGSRGAYVDATFEAGEEYGVPVIDLHQLSIDLYGELAFCPVPGGDVSAETSGPVGDFFCDDHTHFSDAGAVTIAGLVANALGQQPINLARYVAE